MKNTLALAVLAVTALKTLAAPIKADVVGIVWVTQYTSVVETTYETTTVWVPSSPATPVAVPTGAHVAAADNGSGHHRGQGRLSASWNAPTASAPLPQVTQAPVVPAFTPAPAPQQPQTSSAAPPPAPVTWAVAPPVTSATPSPPSPPSGQQTYTGDLTYYDPGLGSCGITSTSSDSIVAISHVLMDAHSTGNPNTNPLCGKTINITYQGKTTTATVVDTCPSCSEGSLDLTSTLFQTIAGDLGQGRVSVATPASAASVPTGADVSGGATIQTGFITPSSADTSTIPTQPTTTPSDTAVPPTTSAPVPTTTPTPSEPQTSIPTFTPPQPTPTTPTSIPVTTPISTTDVTPTPTPSSTAVVTSFFTITTPGDTSPSVVTLTSTLPVPTTTSTPISSSSTTTTTSATSTPTPGLQNGGTNTDSGSHGLSTAGITAIAVVIPVVVVAALVLFLIWWFRKRKQRKAAEEERRKEVEEYGYNPNNDPTLPAVATATTSGHDSPPQMSEDAGGYRGWGGAATTTIAGSSARKQSTNLSNGVGGAFSDDGLRGSPGSGPHDGSVGNTSGEPLVDGTNSGAPGAAAAAGGVAGAGGAAAGGIHRGPSNASSSYSAAGHTDGSDDGQGNAEYGYDTNYSQYTPYRPNASGYDDQPIIRDVSARRQTKLENPGVFPQQGNSTGIAQNF